MKKDILIIAAAFMIFFSCKNMMNNPFSSIRGEGAVEKFTRDVNDFKGVEVSEAADVSIRQGAEFKVLIEAQKNIADLLETSVENGILKIYFKKGTGSVSYDKLHIYVQAPDFDKLKLSGSGNLETESALTGQSLDLILSGSGDAKIKELNYSNVVATVTGSGNINIDGGSSEKIEYEVSGSGDIDSKELKAKDVVAHVTGSGNINCSAETTLDASVTGSGDIYYAGTPSVKSRITGSGSIEKK